jgi:chemotaxis protein methyltransferase CheR
MYFTPENYRASVARLARSLSPEGYLFLGSAETLRGVSQDFHLCHTHGAFYYRLKSERELRQAPARERYEPRAQLPGTPVKDASAWVAEIGRAAARIMALSNERSALPVPSQTRAELAPPGTNLRAALDLLHKEQFADALEQVRALPPAAAQDPEAMLLESVLLASASKFSEAQGVCQRLLERDELNAGAHYVLALCSAGSDQLDRAAHHDRVAMYLDPGFAMPKLHLGLLLRRGGDRMAARAELAQARSLLEREDAARLLLFGGGFNRSALLALCDAELLITAGSA